MARRRTSRPLEDRPGPWDNGPLSLYHGTTLSNARAIKDGIDLGRSKGSVDFGRGFYTTTWLWQAWHWARAKARPGDPAAVCWFAVDRDDLARLEVLCFVRWSGDADDLWTFIPHCRRGRTHQRAPGVEYYDVVYGPVARRWEQRIAHAEYDQVTVHTQRAAALLDASWKGILNEPKS